MRQDVVWQDAALAERFVREVRGGVPYGADQLAMMVRVIAAGGHPVRRFVDLGCGAGIVAQTLLASWPQAQAMLVDFSEPMLAQARLALSDVTPAPRFAVGDLADPGWVDAVRDGAPYDVVASSYAIHHLTDVRKRALYGEILALLAPGGTFVNVEHVASATPGVERMSDALFIDAQLAHQHAQGARSTRDEIAAAFVNRPDKAANILAPVETQCAWLRELGYVDVDCFFKVFELAVFGGRRV
ncbi:MAG: class I SAM-dependent methyltransferase [Deltaproteobacteria bacterium]|nr:class I SAM-dependent methyltransferase [Deltaproteobacteria bacterium]